MIDLAIGKTCFFNPFILNVLFLYPQKTSENGKIWCFQGQRKGALGTNGLKKIDSHVFQKYFHIKLHNRKSENLYLLNILIAFMLKILRFYSLKIDCFNCFLT